MSILLLTVSFILFCYLLPEILRLKKYYYLKTCPTCTLFPISYVHIQNEKKVSFYVKMLKAELCEFDKVFLFFKNFFNFKIQKYHLFHILTAHTC